MCTTRSQPIAVPQRLREHHLRAEHVGLEEDEAVDDAARHVRLGGEVHDRVGARE